MTISLMALPYRTDALSPHLSSETLHVHHDEHHKGYVSKVNAAIEDTALASADLESIVRSASKSGDKKLFNAAAQAWNHGFYWHSLSPQSSGPSSELANAIARDFGSIDELKRELAAEAIEHFASGWAWLVAGGNGLEVVTTHDAGTMLIGKARPLLTIDLWEHAYYIDFRSERPAHVNAVIRNCLNWDFASTNFARAEPWTYPSRHFVG